METNSDSSANLSARQSPRHSLGQLRAGVEDLIRWWRQELLDMVPDKWRQWSTPKLRVEATPGELLVFNPPQREPIDRISLNEPPFDLPVEQGPISRCDLVLSSDLGLSIPISLPDAAETNLRNVVGFSMDRYTPFNEHEVFFDIRVTQRDRKNRKIELMLYVVQHSTLKRLMDQLVAVGLKPSSVDIIDDQVHPPLRAGVNLLPNGGDRKEAVRARLNTVLAVSALLMLLVAMAIPIYERHYSMRDLEQELATLRAPVREAEVLRDDVNQRSNTLRIVLERRNIKPPVVELLRELTRLTPDEAWAGQLEIKGGRLRITGEAKAGSELMQALTTSSYFVDPRFEAPLTQNPKSGSERFVISLAIKERSDEL